MVKDNISTSSGHAGDEFTPTSRPARPARAASYDIDPSASTPNQAFITQAQQLSERTPTSPTTPTFTLSPYDLFASGVKSEPMLLGGWSRKGAHIKGAKQHPSLVRPSRLLSDDVKTDLASLASDQGEKGRPAPLGRAGRRLFGLPPLRYMLFTRKGRRGLALNARAWSSYRSLIALVLLLLLFFRLFLSPSGSVERDVNGHITAHRASDAVFLNGWIDHVITHPVRARDKAGFAEMGLRTEMYSHLLRHPTLPNFDRMERALWPFVPGINQLRRWWQASVQAKPILYAAPSAPRSGNRLVSRAFGSSSSVHQRGSRGIVMSLGYKGSVFASQFISIIREKHENDIPIELYYYGDSDLPAKYRDYLTRTYRNVRCIDLESLGLFDPDLVQLERQGFAIKPFALLATNFTEVMLADADAILLEDPDHFFEEPGYLDTGTLFFHDRDHLRQGADDIIQEFMNNQLSLRGPSPRLAQSEFWKKKGIFEQESGIVVVDKRKTDVFAALLFTAWQNMGEIRKKTTYRIWWGDKETFWLAFEFSNFPYYFVPRYAQAIGTSRRRSKAERLAEKAKAKAKANKVKAGDGEGAGAADGTEEKKIAGKKVVVEKPTADEAGGALAPPSGEENPFKEGILPGEPEFEVKPDSPFDQNVARPANDLVSPDSASTKESSSDMAEEEEEFCSEHPLHFLGADVDDLNHDGQIDTMTLGRPAWFNGGILDVKVLSDEIYIQPNAFTLDGAWEFLFEEERWCIRNYTKGNIKEFDLTDRIDEIKSIAKKAEDGFRAKIPKVKSVKEAVLEDK
ncbi:uncharacterized protein MEPE_03469 [Melanopsichium pennsylvanicum]|uniref:Uncharacterized protein n=2 Tax=Melanopsichium pennsylvanicum TaxID=63383 RepID=A0AAJ4XM62_9BASI|nr:conserved hypothetical protein [Melanopsichium pennsylvanicum 4]SNX84760.1 uncharacterized protein MEPE_03469 [Melanopsichium pennsylvanicum]